MDAFDFIVEEVDSIRQHAAHRKEIDQAATKAELARRHDLRHVLIACEPQLRTQRGNIEAFALLSARVRHKIHDEFPELTDAMLSVLYPHALAPVPSCAVVQFTLDPVRATPEGVGIQSGSPLLTDPVAALPCKYRTCYPVTLWPITVAERLP